MITGQRAFRGESKISTLAAIVEKAPPPASEISSSTPPEVERLIGRCLRKDVNRRSQNMADVKLALEELRDESESGKLVRPAAAVEAGARRWVWPTVAVACMLIAAAAFIWVYFNLRGTQSKGPDLVRVSPADPSQRPRTGPGCPPRPPPRWSAAPQRAQGGGARKKVGAALAIEDTPPAV